MCTWRTPRVGVLLSLAGVVTLVGDPVAVVEGRAPTTQVSESQRARAVLVMTPGDINWTPVDGYPPGYARTMLEGEAASAAPFTYRVRLPAAFRFQPHTHDSDEHVTVLQGVWSFGVGETFDASRLRAVPAGSFVIIPAGTPHFVATERETVIQVHGFGPIGFKGVIRRGVGDEINR